LNKENFDFSKASKTNPENTFLNLQSFLFVTSKQLTKFFFYVKVSPHLVIFLSLLFGIAGSYLMIKESMIVSIAGSMLLFYKNVLDKVDGSLARAKNLDSRRGRFYDSISDFIVSFCTFFFIGYYLFKQNGEVWSIVLSFLGLIFSMIQCSYFIFYQVSFIKASGKETINRLDESVKEEDKAGDKFTLFLQRIFLLIYGWQDKLIIRFDKFLCRNLIRQLTEKNIDEQTIRKTWYENKTFLTMASSLSIGTHIFLICTFSVIKEYKVYLFINLIFMNLLVILFSINHYISTKRKLSA